MSADERESGPACPLPVASSATIRLAHGGGGRLMHDLLQDIIWPAFANPAAETDCDSATLCLPPGRQAFTTDSFVVRPTFFPGGDIGKLAVCGTVNDLAMVGARPLYLSVGFILEEGWPVDDLRRVVASMRAAADAAQVQIVTGDTKVVDHGKGDGIYVNTSGVGVLEHDLTLTPAALQPGDVIIVSGDVGRHGMAVMSAREGLAFEQALESDCAALAAPVQALLAAGCTPRVMRDCTRGGLATALIEIARTGGARLRIEGRAVPVTAAVRGACELLGMDPLYVANEGCFCVVLPPDQAERALTVLRRDPACARAVHIGEVLETQTRGQLWYRNELGVDRILDWLSGEQLPRIC